MEVTMLVTIYGRGTIGLSRSSRKLDMSLSLVLIETGTLSATCGKRRLHGDQKEGSEVEEPNVTCHR